MLRDRVRGVVEVRARARVKKVACRWVSPMMSDETTDMEEHVMAASATSAPG